jgi:hypothetical protein
MISLMALLKRTVFSPLICPQSISSISGPERSTMAIAASRAGRRCRGRIGLDDVGRLAERSFPSPPRGA